MSPALLSKQGVIVLTEEGAVVRTISLFGVSLSLAFAAFAIYNKLSAMDGAWQADFFTIIATLPFSLAANALCDGLQNALSWPHSTRVAVEMGFIFVIGLVEYYCIGMFLGKVTLGNGKKDKVQS